MASPPLVSVILPAYRRADFVNQAIESVSRQTFTDYELIVVDDGSGDDVVAQYQLPASARLIRRAVNSGGAAAPRNDGIAAARGTYLAFLDMDDVWHEEKLASQVAILAAHPEVGVTFCHYTRVDEALAPLPEQPSPAAVPPDLLKSLIERNLIHTPSQALVRRQVLTAAGLFDAGLSSAEDWDCWLRLARAASFSADPVSYVSYRCHPGQQTADHYRICRASIRVLEKTGAWLAAARPDLLPHLRRTLAMRYYRQAKMEITAHADPPVIYQTLKSAIAGSTSTIRPYRGFVRLGMYMLKRWLGG